MGKIRLDRAIALYQKVYPGGRRDTFRVVWRAFYLEPDAPAGGPGVPWAERHAQKFGRGGHGADAARGRRLRGQLAAKGRQHGLEFSFGGRIGSTRDAHRLIALAGRREKEKGDGGGQGQGLQDRVVMQLFRDFFEGEADITSRGMLADVAAQAGLGRRADMLEWLESGEGSVEVDEEARRAREEGQMKGVPRFVVQGKHVIDGAQDEQAFMEAFVKVKEEVEGESEKCASSSLVGSEPEAAASCAPGGSCS